MTFRNLTISAAAIGLLAAPSVAFAGTKAYQSSIHHSDIQTNSYPWEGHGNAYGIGNGRGHEEHGRGHGYGHDDGHSNGRGHYEYKSNGT